MNKYEAMFIVKPDLTEEQRKNLLHQIGEVIAKFSGNVSRADIWSEKRRLLFPIKRQQEGIYYLVNFNIPSDGIAKIREVYRINEDILRVLISRLK